MASTPDYDSLYHQLFSQPGVVAQLLRGFADGPWLAELQLESMERLNTKFHADTGQRREGDMVWRIPRRNGADSFLLLLLEFQSTSDRYMALRVLTYAGLLWQQLVREQRLAPDGMLPPVLPVMVYNGDARWRAPAALAELVGLPAPSPLWHWQPALRYHLIDAGTFTEADLAARDSLPALWSRLEAAADPTQAVAVADAVLAWLDQHRGFAAERRAFADLLGAMLAPLGAAVKVPEDLLEMRSMLATRAEQWKQAWLLEGLQKGREEGRQEGQQAGEAAMLLRQLQRRFGTLPDWATDRVRAADIATLEGWGLRILDAASLGEVFNERPD